TVYSTTRAYNLTSKTWSTLPNLKYARHGMGAAVVGNNIYAMDGASLPGHNGSSSSVQFLAVSVASGHQLGSQITGGSAALVSQAFVSVALSPDGKTLATGSANGTVQLWDVATGRQIRSQTTGSTRAVVSVAFSP